MKIIKYGKLKKAHYLPTGGHPRHFAISKDGKALVVACRDDNMIEIFPFIMKMDRYTTAISGKQDMDMNLDYHISVLKSPIPMRMGINITGNLDDFKFKIGKALYKDTNLPVYTRMIDSTRINLLGKIKDIYKTTD